MAMQPGNVAVPDKISWYNHSYQLQMDERDGFMMWMRSEFAAANAIIDALCHHLQSVGEPGEYDGLIVCIQQRRCNWNAILHMQQYFPVNEVIYALQQVGWRRQQKVMGFEGGARKEYRRGGSGIRGVTEGQSLGNEVNGIGLNVHENGNEKEKESVEEDPGNTVENIKDEEHEDNSKKTAVDLLELDEKSETASSGKSLESIQDATANILKKTEGTGSQDSGGSALKLLENHSLTAIPKSYVSTEICDGEPVNVVDGMKHYENLLEDLEVSELVFLVNDLRMSGRRGELPGQTFTILKRPMKGRGRETIQLGVPIADPPHEDEVSGISKALETEPIPSLLHDVIERILSVQAITVKPDSCIIDIFNEGDYSQPHIWPQWFGRPICVLFLTQCEMSFGKVIVADHPGDYQGALKLSLSPGSVLVMEGRSSNFARHAIPSQKKQRILVTLTKSQPSKSGSSPSYWTPSASRSSNHVAAKHAPSIHPQLPIPNGIRPIFIPSLARNPQPRSPLAGTGVFLPPKGSIIEDASSLESGSNTSEINKQENGIKLSGS